MVGNKPNYDKEDVLRVFLQISAKPISRAELCKRTELGEGTIRTILNILKNNDLIEGQNTGHSITDKGKIVKAKIFSKILGPEEINIDMFKEYYGSAILVRETKGMKISFEHRDDAIRKGAYSAMIFRFNKDLIIPGAEVDFKKEYPEDYNIIINKFGMTDGDILIISFAENLRVAEIASLAVAQNFNELDVQLL